MPTDLALQAEAGRTLIRDRSGSAFPFSKGLLATSILATGLETDRAYRIAEEVGRTITSKPSPIDADALVDLAARTIAERAGAEAAERYLGWRRVKRAGRPLVICLAGAPGVGKSTLATRLAIRLGINRVITTDAIREVLRTVIPPAVSPELHVSTYESINDHLADTSPLDCYRRQARAVSAANVAVASRLAKEGRSMILEGVHVWPGRVRTELEAEGLNAIVLEVMLLLEDEENHRSRLTRRSKHEPARRGERSLQRFPVIRRLQEELHRMARAAHAIEHDVSHPEDLTQAIVDHVVARTSVSRDPARTV